jgi:SOS-response transcriptional repressor LexA
MAPAKRFTPKQGQYLAFIYAYTRLHSRPPAEADMQQYFRVSPPSVHQMVLTFERAGFIRRQPGVARNIEILVDPEHLPVRDGQHSKWRCRPQQLLPIAHTYDLRCGIMSKQPGWNATEAQSDFR